MKRTMGAVLVCMIGVPFLALTVFARQAETTATNDEELNLRAYETLLRSDVSAKRDAVVKEVMGLSDSDEAKFEPIYREYETERAKLDEAEAQVMGEYTRDYQSMSNDEADRLMSKGFETEEQRAHLRKKYFDKMKKEVSAATAARFFEVDSQLQSIADLQTASKLPANQ